MSIVEVKQTVGDSAATETVKLDTAKLLGFRNVAADVSSGESFALDAGAAFNKIGSGGEGAPSCAVA